MPYRLMKNGCLINSRPDKDGRSGQQSVLISVVAQCLSLLPFLSRPSSTHTADLLGQCRNPNKRRKHTKVMEGRLQEMDSVRHHVEEQKELSQLATLFKKTQIGHFKGRSKKKN